MGNCVSAPKKPYVTAVSAVMNCTHMMPVAGAVCWAAAGESANNAFFQARKLPAPDFPGAHYTPVSATALMKVFWNFFVALCTNDFLTFSTGGRKPNSNRVYRHLMRLTLGMRLSMVKVCTFMLVCLALYSLLQVNGGLPSLHMSCMITTRAHAAEAVDDERPSSIHSGHVSPNAGTASPQNNVPLQLEPTTWHWKKGAQLGKGAYGVVYLAHLVDTGQLVAVKQVPPFCVCYMW
jgi:hypothetical protein